MRIAYVTNVRLPSERAHGHQIAQVCAALAALGHDVDVFAPFRLNPIQQSFHAYYGAPSSVSVRHLGTVDPIDHRFVPRILQLPLLNGMLRYQLKFLRYDAPYDLLYTRSTALLYPLIRSGIPVVLELHSIPRRGRRMLVSLCNACARVVCLTSPMRNALVRLGVQEDRVIVEGDAVDLAAFEHMPSQADARTQMGVVTTRPVVGYVGRLKTLGMEKGVQALLEATAAARSSAHPVFALIVGGPQADRDAYAAQATALGLGNEDVLFTGSVPSADVPVALAACDVLTMPFPDLPHYRTNMSPLKMFEYMAADRPIITSDLPTIRDVLSEETAYFCTPGSSASLADVIAEVVQDPQASARARAARGLVEHHTWQRRMQRILEHATLAG